MEFKQLDIKPERKSLMKALLSPHIKKSIIYTTIGAIAGFGFFYFTEGKHLDSLTIRDILKSMLIGGFFGFFVTNSPCARGRC